MKYTGLISKTLGALALIALFLYCSSQSGGTGDTGGTQTYTLTLTLEQPTNASGNPLASGKPVYGKLVAGSGTYTDPALYSGYTVFPSGSGTATMTITGITNGTYTGHLMIDINGNADTNNPLPDTGDYGTSSPTITISSNISDTVHAEAWIKI